MKNVGHASYLSGLMMWSVMELRPEQESERFQLRPSRPKQCPKAWFMLKLVTCVSIKVAVQNFKQTLDTERVLAVQLLLMYNFLFG